jgi:acetyl-CoA acetyltransferase family protein
MVAWNTTEKRVAIVAGSRTPFAKMGGPLKSVHVTDLAKRAMEEALYRSHWRVDRLDEVILGNVIMPVDAANPARVSAEWAGVPHRVPALTVQRNCASGIEAIAEAASRIRSGQSRAILAGGAESMSQIPLLFPNSAMEPFGRLARSKSLVQKLAASASLRPRHFKPIPALEGGLTDPSCGLIMGKTAEILAKEFNISRLEQDEFALRSHQRVQAAAEAGKFEHEISPFYVGPHFEPLAAEVGPRFNQSLAALGNLKPIFDRRDGTVTVGNSCQVTDGAAAMMVMDADLAKSEGLEVLGYVTAYAVAALDPARMGLGPVFAIDQLLRKSGMAMSDIPLFEINEAFAAQVLACQKAMGSDKFAAEHLDRPIALGEIPADKLNVNGGAIALGHPVGATGARLVLTLLLEMQRRNLDLGVAALCVGGGQGAAMLLERS